MATGSDNGRTAPQPIPSVTQQDVSSSQNVNAFSPPSKKELVSWWRKFSRKPEKDENKVTTAPGIFGVPLSKSIRYANVAISLTNEQGESFIYGYVPIVVAKCGVFLKEKATDVEGIFRLSGSAKRIKDLQAIFNSPERYGKGLDWTGYTVHDAANILRRYLNQLPEPIVPLDCYERFRDPLRSYQSRVGQPSADVTTEFTSTEHSNAVVAYQKLITELPALNRQLLLYILDLLAVFASKSDFNRMTAANLAAIFQPGIISHPVHDMAPQEYRLSQDVLIFLIENQDNFLIGMSGTAVDAQTQKDVESGAPSLKSPKPTTTLVRSASNASGGANSLRKYGVRRNLSTSSHASRDRVSPNVSGPGTPASPSYPTSMASGSLGRSNTVPSKRSPAIGQHRFQRHADSSTQNSPAATPPEEANKAPNVAEKDLPLDEAEMQQHLATVAATMLLNNIPTSPDPPHVEHDSNPTPTVTQPARSRERKISNLFSKSPIFGPSAVQVSQQERQPRKLQKRQRIPGMNKSAQSSSASLQNEDGFHTPLMSPDITTALQADPMASTSTTTPQKAAIAEPGSEQKSRGLSSSHDRQTSIAGLKPPPPHSPTTSLHSRGSMTENSDFDALDDTNGTQEKRRNRWRFSSSAQRPTNLPLVPPPSIGQLPGARTSNSSLGSSNRPRHSFSLEPQNSHQATIESSSTGLVLNSNYLSSESTEAARDSNVDSEKKGLFGKWRAKMQQSREEKKEREAERERAKSPQRLTGDNASSRNSLSAFAHEHMAPRTRSIEKIREDSLPVVAEQPDAQGRLGEPSQKNPQASTVLQTQVADSSTQSDLPRSQSTSADVTSHTMQAISEEHLHSSEAAPSKSVLEEVQKVT